MNDDNLDVKSLKDLFTQMIAKDVTDMVKNTIKPIEEGYAKQIEQLNRRIELLNKTINNLPDKSDEPMIIAEETSSYTPRNYNVGNNDYDFSDWVLIPNVKYYLEQQGLKQTWLQEKTQIPQSTLRSILNNEKTISLENALKISIVLGVSINQLFSYVSISDIVLEEE